MERRILLTAFRNTSAEQLLHGVTEYRTLLLPNDKELDSRLLCEMLSREHFDLILSIGQKPNIKDKVHIETAARKNGMQLVTDFDCDRLMGLFETNEICARISYNAGTSFCNALYWGGLHCISRMTADIRMVFLHIPFAKNVGDFEAFRRQFLMVMKDLKEGQV